MNFHEFHLPNGDKITVNLEEIVYFHQQYQNVLAPQQERGTGTTLHFNGKFFETVRETYEEVKGVIDANANIVCSLR